MGSGQAPPGGTTGWARPGGRPAVDHPRWPTRREPPGSPLRGATGGADQALAPGASSLAYIAKGATVAVMPTQRTRHATVLPSRYRLGARDQVFRFFVEHANDEGVVYFTYKQVTEEVGVSRETVRRVIYWLQRKQLVDYERGSSGEKSLVQLRPPEGLQ